MDAEKIQKAKQNQNEVLFRTQVNAEPVMQTGQYVQQTRTQYADQAAPDSLALYREKTAGMKDTAELGSISGKARKKLTREQEEKIRRSKALTGKATAYTEEVHTQLAEVRQRTEKNDPMLQLRFLEQYRFTPQMFVSGEIRAHFKEYAGLVDSYRKLQELAETTNDTELLQRLEAMRPLMQAFTHRMEVYCEQNRVSLTGEILAEKQEASQLTEEETEEWYDLVEKHMPKESELAAAPEEQLTAEELHLVCGQMRELIEFAEKDSETDPAWLEELYLKEQRYRAYALLADRRAELSVEGEVPGEADTVVSEIQEDIRRLERRRLRMELGMPQEEPQTDTAQRTREEAISTYSDQQSYKSRDKLAALNRELRAAGGSANLTETVEQYIRGTRYQVGYTLERERLQAARKAVATALQQENSVQIQTALEKIKEYFDTMTNGTLQIPEGAEIRDYSDKRPREQGSKPDGTTQTELIRMLTYWSDQKDTPLFAHEPTVNDLKQRLVSNCYMMAATAGLVEFSPELLKSCLIDEGETVVVRLYTRTQVKKVKAAATAPTEEVPQEEAAEVFQEETEVLQEEAAEAFQDAEEDQQEMSDDVFAKLMGDFEEIKESDTEEILTPIYVRVNKEIPRIAGADALSSGALWMQMIEKACAFIGRDGAEGYRSLWYGDGGAFLERLLGIEFERVSKDDPDALFEEIRTARERGYVYNAGTEKNVGSDEGLNGRHAYTVMGAKEMNGKKYILLRNPYSTYSLQYQENGEKKRTGDLINVSSDETYGQFYIELSEFVTNFINVRRTNVGALTGQAAE